MRCLFYPKYALCGTSPRGRSTVPGTVTRSLDRDLLFLNNLGHGRDLGLEAGAEFGPAELIEAMENMQSHSTSNPTSISQWAAEAALNGDQNCIPPMVKAFKERAEWLVSALNKIPGVRSLQPAGAFYVFPDCSEAIKRLHAAGKIKAATDMALCDYLMEQPEAVAPVPGSAFGGEGCIRISFATSLENLQKAAARMAKAMG